MSGQSPYLLVSKMAVQLGSVVSAIDILELDAKPRQTLADMQNHIIDARLDVRDYELSETREEQLAKARVAKKRLGQVRKDILRASEYNIFSAVDVAQLTSAIDHIIERLE
jgi:hypothetical protein